MEPENSTFFCKTIETALRKASNLYSRTSLPPTLTEPDNTSYSLGMSCTSEVLEAPVPPMMPMVSPLFMERLMSESARLSLSLE